MLSEVVVATPETVESLVREILRLSPTASLHVDKFDLPYASDRFFYVAKSGSHRFFVKENAPDHASDALLATLSALPAPSFRVPRMLGRIDRIEVWEYIEGTSKPLYSWSEPEIDSLLIALCAGEAAAPPMAGIVPPTYWDKSTARLRERALADAHFKPVASAIRQLGAWEQRIRSAMAGDTLTHNDLNTHNILRTGNGALYILDWGSASLGAPGGTLRTFAAPSNLDHVRDIARRYAQTRGRYGNPVDCEKVFLSMIAHQIMALVRTGLVQRKLDRVRRAHRLGQHILSRL